MDLLASPVYWWPVLIVAPLLLLYFAANWLAWWVASLVLLVPFTFYSTNAWWTKAIVWLIYAVPLIVLTLPPIRRPLISDRMLSCFRDALSVLPETAWQTVDAGTAGWETGLFRGRPRWKRLLAMKPATLTGAERDFLAGPVEELCRLLDNPGAEGPLGIPARALEYMKSAGFFGIAIPEVYGGLGFSAHAQAVVLTKIASRSISAALGLVAPTTLGVTRIVLLYGTDEQRANYCPLVASGQCIPCLALTGPESGDDGAAIEDRGVVCRGEYEGRNDVLGVRLSFDKRYIMLAPNADLIMVSFKLYDPDHLFGKQDKLGITLALVSADAPGVSQGHRHDPMHLNFGFGPLRGRDVFIPLEAIVGGADRIGKAWPIIAETSIDHRLTSLPSLITGGAKLMSRATGAYARIRYQFRSPIGYFQGVQAALARIAAHSYLIEATRMTTDALVVGGEQPALTAAIVKYKLAERLRTLVDDAMDIHGAAGICIGPRNLIAEYSQFVPIAATLGGGAMYARDVEIFGHGVLRCHPYLRREITAALEAHRAPAFDKALSGHLRTLVSNALRAMLHGYTRGRLARAPLRVGERRRYYRQISRLSIAFAFLTDVLILVCHGEPRTRQRLSARMSEVISELYLASLVLRRQHLSDDNDTSASLTEWSVQNCLYRTRIVLEELFDNIDNSWLRRFTRFAVGPLTTVYRSPDDGLEPPLATAMMVPSTARDRMTSGMYLSMDTVDQLGRLEDALAKVTAVEPLERKLADGVRLELIPPGPLHHRLEDAVAAKLLTPDEAERVQRAEAARREALRVDEE